jgi:hypothetical protein
MMNPGQYQEMLDIWNEQTKLKSIVEQNEQILKALKPNVSKPVIVNTTKPVKTKGN